MGLEEFRLADGFEQGREARPALKQSGIFPRTQPGLLRRICAKLLRNFVAELLAMTARRDPGHPTHCFARRVNGSTRKYSTLPKFGFVVSIAHPGSPRGAISSSS
jgi:hypothetical protein